MIKDKIIILLLAILSLGCALWIYDNQPKPLTSQYIKYIIILSPLIPFFFFMQSPLAEHINELSSIIIMGIIIQFFYYYLIFIIFEVITYKIEKKLRFFLKFIFLVFMVMLMFLAVTPRF